MPNIDIIINEKTSYGRPKVNVSSPKEIKCNGQKTGFKCFEHKFSGGGLNTLNLYNRYAIRDRKYIRYPISKIDGVHSRGVVYVFFYGEKDLRPLLICYGGKAYIPKGNEKYDSEWEKDDTVTNCVCEDEEGNEALIKALTTVVGFLNQVDLSKHPSGSGNGCINTGAPGTATTCNTPAGQNNTCAYPVHKYQNKTVKVRVRVTCTPVPRSQSGTNGSCYRKLTHEPAGMNGKGNNGSGFRLGDVTYPNSNGKKWCVPYYPDNGLSTTNNRSSHWRQPLVKVDAYFYDEDKCYKDPLLVVLEFKNGEGKDTDKEYYKLTSSGIGNMKWERETDPSAGDKVKENGVGLVKYLDCIRYKLKKVLRVEKNNHSGYVNHLSKQPGDTKNRLEQLNGTGKMVTVQKCEDGTCSKLENTNYKCYRHHLTSLGEEQLYKIGGVAFTIPKVNGEEKVYVFFYDEDPRPLMLCYGGSAYRPKNKECYFKEWVDDSTIHNCLCEGSSDVKNELLSALTEVTGFLNQVNVYNHPNGTDDTCNSGSPSKVNTCTTTTQNGASCTYVVDTYNDQQVKVKVTCSDVPPGNGTCYQKLTHEPIGICEEVAISGGAGEGFRLGDIVYNGTGVKGRIDYYSIGDNQSEHWCQPLMKVTAYFYDQDKCYNDPLLVELEFKNWDGPKEFEYYKLIKGSDSSKMEWTRDTDNAKSKVEGKGEELVKHLDSIRYEIKKVVQINISSTTSYDLVAREGFKRAGTEFTKLTNGGKEFHVTVVKCKEVECPKLAGAKYKCYKHEISSISNFDYNKIGGVVFTIPSADGKDKPIEIELYDIAAGGAEKCETGEKGKNGQITQLTYNTCMGDIYVYFYGDDPRPLLFCYGDDAYKPSGKDSYDKEWVIEPGIGKCVCEGTGECVNCDRLLKELIKVLGFLNEVNLYNHPTGTSNGCTNSGADSSTSTTCATSSSQNNSNTCTYDVHKYNSKSVRVKVDCSPVPSTNNSCYRKLTHTPAGINGEGTGGAGEGFRLGDIVYNGTGVKGRIDYYSIGDNQSEHWCQPLMKVTAYFYDQDKCYKDPLLVELVFSNGTGSAEGLKEYYKLMSSGPVNMEWESNEDTREKVCKANDDKLVKYLDKLRYELKHVIKVEIDKKGSYPLMGRAASDTGNGFKPLPNGAKEVTVEVSECVDCVKVQESRYRCYVQHISSIKSLDYNLIAGLKFYIPKNLPKGATSSQDNGKEVILHNIKENSIELATGVQQSTGTQNSINGEKFEKYEHIYYNKCMNDIYVYFYNDDPRPGLLCFNDNVYKPKKLPEQGLTEQYDYSTDDYRKWYNVQEIKSCLCRYDRGECITYLVNQIKNIHSNTNHYDLEIETLVKLLTELYFGNRFVKFFREHWVELSAGSGTGVVGLSSIGGGGYIMNAYLSFVKWFV